MPADHREPGRLTHVAKVRFRSHIDIDSLPDWRFSEREWNPPELTLIRLAEPGSCTQRQMSLIYGICLKVPEIHEFL